MEVYGKPSCGACARGLAGLCGGGGYIISRPSLLRMANITEAPVNSTTATAFLDHFMSPPDNVWCDVRFGCVAQETKHKLRSVRGLYGWGFEFENKSVNYKWEDRVIELRQEEPPLVIHYVKFREHFLHIYNV